MKLFHLFLFFLLRSESIFAITCNFFRQRKDGVERSPDTCTGDYCYTYTAIFEIGYDQGCVTGIILPTQCWTDRSGTLCVCDNDMCNTPERRDLGEVQTRTQCHNDFTAYHPLSNKSSLDGPYNNYNTEHGSATCDVHCSMKYYGSELHLGEMFRGEPLRESGSFRILIGTTGYEFMRYQRWGKERGRFTLFYYGGLYVSNYGLAGLRLFGRCKTDHCNTWTSDSLAELLRGVVCRASNFAYTNESAAWRGECQGQMCAISTSYVESENTTYRSQFCFSQNSEVAEYPILVNHYTNMNVIDFAIQDFYLCAEDDCNKDVETAQASINKYKESHKEDYPPRRNPKYKPS